MKKMCVKLVIYIGYTEMHGQQKVKLSANVADFEVLFYSSEFGVLDISFPFKAPNFNYWLLHKPKTDFPSKKN